MTPIVGSSRAISKARAELEERRRPERVAHLRPVDGQLGDAAGGLVANVLPLAGRDPLHDGMHLTLNSNRSLSMVARQGPGGRRGTLARMTASELRRVLRAGRPGGRRAAAGARRGCRCSAAPATRARRCCRSTSACRARERAALIGMAQPTVIADEDGVRRADGVADRSRRSPWSSPPRERPVTPGSPSSPRSRWRPRCSPRPTPSTPAPRTGGSPACRWRTSADCSCSSATCSSGRRSRSGAASPARSSPRLGDARFTSLVPTQLTRLLDAGADLGRFRAILVGGSGVDAELTTHGRRRPALRMVPTYGMTETCGGVVYAGRPLAGVEVRAARWGELLVRGPTLMRGYRLDPDASVAAFEPGGWLRTGDGGEVEADGTVRVLGQDRGRDRQRRREDLAGGGRGGALEPPGRRRGARSRGARTASGVSGWSRASSRDAARIRPRSTRCATTRQQTIARHKLPARADPRRAPRSHRAGKDSPAVSAQDARARYRGGSVSDPASTRSMLTVADELVEVRLDGPGGERIHLDRVARVERRDQVHRRERRPSARRGEHLRLALQAVSDVLVDQRAGVVDALAVPGQDCQRLQRLHARAATPCSRTCRLRRDGRPRWCR